MKMPWTIAVEALDDRVAKTMLALKGWLDEELRKKNVSTMNLIAAHKRSEQIKLNRLKNQLSEIEDCFKAELAHYRKTIEEMEKAGPE